MAHTREKWCKGLCVKHQSQDERIEKRWRSERERRKPVGQRGKHAKVTYSYRTALDVDVSFYRLPRISLSRSLYTCTRVHSWHHTLARTTVRILLTKERNSADLKQENRALKCLALRGSLCASTVNELTLFSSHKSLYFVIENQILRVSSS